MNLIKILAIFLLLISAQSCCQKLYFKKNDLKWANPYQVNDVLVFKSDRNSVDSIKIVNKEFTKPKESRECNWFVSFHLTESVFLDYQIFHKGKWSDTLNLFYLDKRPKSMGNELIMRAFQLEFFRPELITENTFLKLHNRNVTDSYIFTKDRAYTLNKSFGIVKFYWSEDMGLIKYISEDGETWELESRM